jgi:3-oxoacyl-[acyl-carrier-protein] synthase II
LNNSKISTYVIDENKFSLAKLKYAVTELDYIITNPREFETEYFMSNNFAFGGINTSLIFKRI